MQYCVSSERTAVLLKIMDFTPNDLQKVLVFTNSVDEVEMVYKVTTKYLILCICFLCMRVKFLTLHK